MSKMRRFIILSAALLLGCFANLPVMADQQKAVLPAAKTDVHLDAQAQQAIAGANAFSVDLFKRVRKTDRNLFFSPASVAIAMSFAYRGAAGKTAQELRTVLHFPYDPAPNLRAYGAVLDTMEISTPCASGAKPASCGLHTANAIWANSALPLATDFTHDMATYAKAGLQRVAFGKDPEGARRTINRWVSDATRQHIPALLGGDDVSRKTAAILVNAIYFKDDWIDAFSKDETKPEPFTSIDGTKTVIPLMHQDDRFRVQARDGVKAILLPYIGGEVSMAIFLPDRPRSLPTFENALTAAKLADWLAALDAAAPRETILTLPRMSLRWRSELAKSLSAMGAPDAFSDTADFSAMRPAGASAEPRFTISNVVQEATLDVDETGTVATAATAVGVEAEAAVMVVRKPPFIFRADRPFFFLLRDNRTGLILFLGREVRP